MADMSWEDIGGRLPNKLRDIYEGVLEKEKYCEGPEEICALYEDALERSEKIISEDPSYGRIYDWDISFQGAPFITFLRKYAESLVDFGMMKRAKKVCERAVGLTHRDGLGVRFLLAGIYGYFGSCSQAEKVRKKFGDDSCEMSLHLAASYYKKCDFLNAKNCIIMAYQQNQHLRNICHAAAADDSFIEKARLSHKKGGFAYGSYQQYLHSIGEDYFLYNTSFFEWAGQVLDKYQKGTGDSRKRRKEN